MRPVIDGHMAVSLALAGCIGLGVGALAWLMMPPPDEGAPLPGRSARPVAPPSAKFGELLISPLTFAGSEVMIQPTLSGPVVSTGMPGDVRLLGVVRSARGGRALLAQPDGKMVWIRRGTCLESLCVTAVGPAWAVLTVAGQSRRIDLFDQKRSATPGPMPGASTPPSPALASPPPPGEPQPGGVEPKSAPPGTLPSN
jgi:hypothetical protein